VLLPHITSPGNYNSGLKHVSIEFQAKKNASLYVALGHFSRLWAADGLIETLGAMMTMGSDPITSHILSIS